MRSLPLSTLPFLFAIPICAQTPSGSIIGTVIIDGPVADATVEAKHSGTGTVYSTTTDNDGYELNGLPSGVYEVAVPPLGWRTKRFVETDVAVQSGETVQLDIHLEQQNLGVIGDDFAYVAIRNKYSELQGETPRTADGRPDLSGVWQGDVDPNEATPDLLPWAAEETDRRNANHRAENPEGACLPGPTPVWPTIYRFVQTPSIIVQLFEYQPGFRQIFVDGRDHPDDLDPTWMGHSVGQWDGDTLVVDTVGFNDRSWLWNAYPHTSQLHVVERFTRLDLATMRVDVTIEDPGALTTPWNLHLTWRLAPSEEVLEYICNDNNLFFENIGLQ
jgi:hypothetical protein